MREWNLEYFTRILTGIFLLGLLAAAAVSGQSVTVITNPDGSKTTIAYTPPGQFAARFTNPDGSVTTVFWTPATQPSTQPATQPAH